MLALSMALQFIDKAALPAASILGIIEDLVLSLGSSLSAVLADICEGSQGDGIFLG